VVERVRVEAAAFVQHRHGPRQSVIGLRDLVALPPGTNPRTLQWAAQLRSQPDLAQADARTLSAAVLRHIATGGFSYTLEPGPYDRDAIDEFWLDRKLGFCEHFAATFVVVMRSLGVPARVVTGYQGAEAPDDDGYRTVRQSNAHAWAEYWQEGVGWVRADPTAAVAPDRILSSRSLRPPPGFAGGALETMSPNLVPQLRALWESLDNRWNQWVLNYSRGQQLDLLSKLGIEAPSWQDLAKLLVLILSGFALIGVAWAWWDRQRQDPWQRQSAAIAAQLRRLGLSALPHQPPRQLAGEVRAKFGPTGEPLAALLMVAEHQRYGREALVRPSRAWLATLRTEARRLQRTKVFPEASPR
ncbi:MAG: transglutaminase-like domain-containing protein, partial [Rhizobacter sp.]